jgi:hypothetical protein
MGDVMTLEQMYEMAQTIWREEYQRVYGAAIHGGADADAQTHSEAVDSAAAAVVNWMVEAHDIVPDRGEPTDDEIYNGPGMEGGIAYQPEPVDRSLS